MPTTRLKQFHYGAGFYFSFLIADQGRDQRTIVGVENSRVYGTLHVRYKITRNADGTSYARYPVRLFLQELERGEIFWP